MRIAVITNTFPALSETFILDQITGLLDMGHDVQIYSYWRPEVTKVHKDVDSYRLLDRTHYVPDMPKNKILLRAKTLCRLILNFPKAPRRLTRVLRYLLRPDQEFIYRRLFLAMQFLQKDFDIIHCHFGDVGLTGVLLKKMGLKAKLVTTFHGHDANRVSGRQGKVLYRDLFKSADIITANTNFTKRQIVKMGCKENKIAILPVGLHVDRFAFKERMLAEGEPVKIFSVGRLVEKKGHEYSIRAIAKLICQGCDVLFTIAGDGTLMDELKAIAGELGVQEKITFAGALSQDEVVRLYAQSHIFVLASVTASDGDREGQGLVLQEAQAAGLPVVSTLHNGIPEGVLQGQSAFLVPEKDIDALTERLRYLLDHPDIWPDMGRQGRAYVEKNYQIEHLNNSLVQIFHDLLTTD